MEKVILIAEMGIHAHPSYCWDAPQSARTEGAIEMCAEDSLAESQYCAGWQPALRKPVMAEEPLLQITQVTRRRAS